MEWDLVECGRAVEGGELGIELLQDVGVDGLMDLAFCVCHDDVRSGKETTGGRRLRWEGLREDSSNSRIDISTELELAIVTPEIASCPYE